MSQDKIKEVVNCSFTQYLTQHGMRKTPERYTILNKILEFPGHFTLQQLYSQLKLSGYRFSRTTIFNSVSLFVSAGLVRKHSFNSDIVVYELVIGSIHHHLICTGCGMIKEIKITDIDETLLSRRFGKFLPARTDIKIYGLCSACQRQMKKSQYKSHKSRKTNINDEQS